MYLTDEILEKVNDKGNETEGIQALSSEQPITLADIMVQSFAEVKALTEDTLSYTEQEFLYQQAQSELDENIMAESSILSRANPQLENATGLGILQSAMQRGYDTLFPQRASEFVRPGAVSSMFSPAGYLTELYREARNLHATGSQYHLDIRRPDLAGLSLSQRNMDDEVSTLTLSNELLMENIRASEGKDTDAVQEMLATYRQTGETPYHAAYEATRNAIILQDENFTAFQRNPQVSKLIDSASLLAIQSAISPELYNILTEEITEDNAAEVARKNFGDDFDITLFQNVSFLAHYYGLTYGELTSILNVLTSRSDIVPGVEYFQNDQLAFVKETNSGLEVRLLQRRITGNTYTDQMNYCELIPAGGDEYDITINFKSYLTNVWHYSISSTGYDSRNIHYQQGYSPEINKHYQYRYSFSDEKLKNGIEIYIYRLSSRGGLQTQAPFSLDIYSFELFLLKINKLIRLYKATGIPVLDLRAVIDSSNSKFVISPEVLSKLFWTSNFMREYALDVSAALTLSGAEIGQTTYDGQESLFNRLFNTPQLNGQTFYADSTPFSLKPEDTTDSFRTAVLKRAFQVNDTELFTLWTLAQGTHTPGNFTSNIENLSALYRIKLLADINGVSVTELVALLSVSPWASVAIITLSGEALATLVSFLRQYTQWLHAQNLTVGDLYMMTVKRYGTILTPDIEELITTLKNGLADRTFETWRERALALAPFVAAAMQLDSADTAYYLLVWINNLQPEGLSLNSFLTLVMKETRTETETAKMVGFCQVLAQLTLIVRTLGLSSAALSLAVMTPAKLLSDTGITTLPHDIATVRGLARFHSWLQQCGTSATSILSALDNGSLSPEQLAQGMLLDEQLVKQALLQTRSNAAQFGSWAEVDTTLQWMDMATSLGITPADVARLMGMNYITSGGITYDNWIAVSNALQAGLSARQTTQLQGRLDESLSSALSAWVIKNNSPSEVINRNALYSWLLMDNQVSAQIKTTPVAEAIASVQLYVNRALSGQEDGVVNTARSRRFFTDWERVNKRYSTWAGTSELVYYPENYIDPTLRIGQTGMMDEMLQSLSQSQLTSDTVEDAFKTYMTHFEDIANLEIISGYHDSASEPDGLTYLIGKSASNEYYWRRADIGMMSAGKLPANAWTDWENITAAISAVNNLVRPVIFQSRLYIVWVESREGSTTSGSTTIMTTEYLLNYAHIRHDGTWSVPVSIAPEKNILPPDNIDINSMGMYCARHMQEEKLYIFFYKIADNYNVTSSVISAINIHADNSIKQTAGSDARSMASNIFPQLSTPSLTRLNSRYHNGHVTYSTPIRSGSLWGTLKYTIVQGSSFSDISTEYQNADYVTVNFSTTARLIFDGTGGGTPSINMMKKIGSMGDAFYLPSSKSTGAYALTQNYSTECAVSNTDGNIYFSTSDNYTNNGLVPYYLARTSATPPDSSATATITSKGSNGLWSASFPTTTNAPGWIFVCRSKQFPSAGPDFTFNNFWYLNTTVDIKDVELSATVGSAARESFTADARSKYTFDESLFHFNAKSINIPLTAFSENTVIINFTITVSPPSDNYHSMGKEMLSMKLSLVTPDTLPAISLNITDAGAQYLQYGVHRIRINTLFARQLVARANTGLNAILSMETQQLQEPQLGKGFYADFVMPRYNSTVHGNSRNFTLNIRHVVDDNPHTVYSGILADTEISVRLFVPLDDKPLHATYIAKIFLLTAKTTADKSNVGAHFIFSDSNPDTVVLNPANSDISMFSDVVIRGDLQSEPMDFSGANALYFWEMFYYVPMMAFTRLLQESRFTDATQWIKYIWSPEGYLVNGQPATWQWNVRPLEDDTSWNASPLDSTDPDAIAQADPMHYKVATFMTWLDLLIARGDAAYRQLERDTLNEARMWYVQALSLLGDEPYLTHGTDWSSPRLDSAADQTIQTSVQQALLDVRSYTSDVELLTANTLTTLFRPQQNEKLAGYWKTLAQRLYNLRNNLSIDGQPLSLAIYATPADPSALLSAAVLASSGGSALPAAIMPLYRFPVILESARGMVNQLIGFGNALLGITERQDAEALSELLQTQGAELLLQSIALQEKTIAEIDADGTALGESRNGALSRLNSYTALYDEDVSAAERLAMDLALSASVISTAASVCYSVGAGLDAVPNIYGMAFGGSRYGAIAHAMGRGIEVAAYSLSTSSDRLSQSEAYRRRRQEWEIQRNAAESEVKQIDAQLDTLAIRREAAVMQQTYLETQQSQTQAQMTFLQNKFSNRALYNWLRGKLAAIYYQFYDLTASRCLMAEEAYKWALSDSAATFIRPGAWQGGYAGLMAGETLMLNLAQMEQSYLQRDQREKEVTRTVCLSEVYAGLADNAFSLAEEVVKQVTAGRGSAGSDVNGLSVSGSQLQATLKLSDLNIGSDYPQSIGNNRCIRQISVTLPALVGPYQDVRAVLSYGGSVVLPRGCNALAVSHGVNDSGQFQLDFNDSRWLPFEGIPVDDTGTLVLGFPEVNGNQKALLLSLTDIILHIRYTIVS